MKNISILVGFVMAVAGCGEKDGHQNSPIQTPMAAQPVKPPPYTKERWREDFLKPFHISGAEVKEDGMTDYSACQASKWTTADKCKHGYFAFGQRDAFRKLDHLTPTWTHIDKIFNEESTIGIYIAAPECKPAGILIAPAVNERGGWLFMKNVSLLADGDLVFEKSFEMHSVTRDNDAKWIHERIDLLLTEADLAQLRKYSSAERQAARITGEKGYIALSKKALDHFNKDVAVTLQMYDEIRASHASGGGPACTQSEESPKPSGT